MRPALPTMFDTHLQRIGALFILALAFAGGYFFAKSGPRVTSIESGVVAPDATNITKDSALVSRCVSICKATVAAGISTDNGMCIHNDINGFACAVVVEDKGHCPSYYSGGLEIVLDPGCGYVNVYRYTGGAE